jgi:hypothetical protein
MVAQAGLVLLLTYLEQEPPIPVVVAVAVVHLAAQEALVEAEQAELGAELLQPQILVAAAELVMLPLAQQAAQALSSSLTQTPMLLQHLRQVHRL